VHPRNSTLLGALLRAYRAVMARSGEVVSLGARMWARRDLRRRWRSLVVLGVLAGLASGLAMAALAGARRTATAFPRLREKTDSADAVVFPSQIGIFAGDWGKLRDEPYVESVAPWSLLFGNYDGQPGGLMFGPVGDTWLQRVDKPVVIRGRMWDPKKPNEVVIDEFAPEATGLALGSTFTFQFYKKGADIDAGKPADGIKRTFTVVGIVRETSEFLFSGGFVIPSPGLLRTLGVTRIENAHVRLKNPATDMAKLKRDAPTVLLEGTPVLDLHQVEVRVSTAISVEHSALLLLAAAVAAAGFVFVGQALVRSVAAVDADAEILSAIGLDRRDLTMAAAIPHLVVAVIGAVGGLVVALALSPRFPIGFAAKVDPGRGFNADLTVLIPGTILTALVIVAGTLTMAWLRERRTANASSVRPPLSPRLGRLGPLPVGLGATMAFDGGRGRRAVPIRPALVGAVVAVLGLTATMTIRHGLDQALANPARVGVTWDAAALVPYDAYDLKRADQLDPAYAKRVLALPGVAALSTVWRSVDDVGGVGVAAFAVDPNRGALTLVTVEGRAPRRSGEVAIGPATARQLDVDIGDDVTIAGRKLRIVGRAFFPVDVHSGFDEGLWLTYPDLLAVSPKTNTADASGPSASYLVTWAKGTDPDANLAAFTKAVPDSEDVSFAAIPDELTNLSRVRTVPAILAAFLVLLGLTTLVHVLVASVRARRRDFAVLRAIGFSRRMSATVVATQGTSIGLVGLVVGLPVGFAIGRGAWLWVSSQVPLVYASPLWLTLIVVEIPVVVIAANLIAAWPARRAGRLQPAEILRTE